MAISSLNNTNLADFATTAHTVSNLLTTLNLSASQLLYLNDKKQIEEFVKQSDNTINSAISAIQHMTILDSLAKGAISPSFVQADVTKLLSRILDSKKYKWSQVSLNLHGSRILTATDSFLIEIIMNELIDNSCRYQSRRVDVSIDKAGTHTRIQVRDDGEGIEAAELANVFEPYYRIKKHRARSSRAGLGLTTVQAVTNKLQGKINLDSHPNWGTKVELIV